jgi:hypothetical protein
LIDKPDQCLYKAARPRGTGEAHARTAVRLRRSTEIHDDAEALLDERTRDTRRANAYTRKISLVSFDKHAHTLIDLEESAIDDTSRKINPPK